MVKLACVGVDRPRLHSRHQVHILVSQSGNARDTNILHLIRHLNSRRQLVNMGQCVGKTGPAPSTVHGFPYRHVVVTGASAGIGAALAIQLSSLPGTTLTLVARNPARLAAVEAACTANGAAVQVFSLDVTDTAAMAQALAQAHKVCPVDLLVANAGIAAAAPSNKQDMSSLADAIWAAGHTNIMGTLNTLAPALPLLKATAAAGRPAAVAIVSSVSVLPPNAVQFTGQLQLHLLPYAWSKQALLSLGTGLEVELSGSGVAVFTICPGVVLTGLAAGLADSMICTAPAADNRSSAAAAVKRNDTASEGLGLGGVGSGLKAIFIAATEAGGAGVVSPDPVRPVTAEEEMKRRLGAITAEEAALHICAALAITKGGVVAFPAAAVRTMKIMSLLPQGLLVKAVKRGMSTYAKNGKAVH